jgi:hypothetical protein
VPSKPDLVRFSPSLRDLIFFPTPTQDCVLG